MSIICSNCEAEPGDPDTAREDGWDLENEFGELCPECVVSLRKYSGLSQNINDIAELIGAEKKE